MTVPLAQISNLDKTKTGDICISAILRGKTDMLSLFGIANSHGRIGGQVRGDIKN